MAGSLRAFPGSLASYLAVAISTIIIIIGMEEISDFEDEFLSRARSHDLWMSGIHLEPKRKKSREASEGWVLILCYFGQGLAPLWTSFGHVWKDRVRLDYLKRPFQLYPSSEGLGNINCNRCDTGPWDSALLA